MASRKRGGPSDGGSEQHAVITLGSLTHLGRHKLSNEDTLCAVTGLNAPPGTDALLAVADGMGGLESGEVASGMAIQGLLRRLSGDGLGDETLPGMHPYGMRLVSIVQEINAEIHTTAAHTAVARMGTTLTAAILAGATYSIAHVGDSRAYLLRKGELRQLTRDHSWVAEEVARGALTPQQAHQHPRRNVITRSVGTDQNVRVDQLEGELQQGDVLFLCSDGLHSLVSDDEIGRTLSQEPQRACASLVQQANSRGGKDNITVVIARIDRVGVRIDHRELAELHLRPTVQLSGPHGGSRRLTKPLRLLLFPIWGPAKAILKLIRVRSK